MQYEWEVAYIDNGKIALRLNHGSRRLIPMIISESASTDGWKVGDLIAIEGGRDEHREIQKAMGLPLSNDVYKLHHKNSGAIAISRKNDYEHEDAHAWLEAVKRGGLK